MIDKKGNSIKPDFIELTRYAKQFSGLTIEKEDVLLSVKDEVAPLLVTVTDNFYDAMNDIPEAASYLEGRITGLKQTHLNWMNSVFTGPYNEKYTESMYDVGDIHVRVNLPVEFMSGGVTLICNELYKIIFELYGEDSVKTHNLISAINSALGFSLFVMQKSYNASVDEALDKFLLITGMSEALFAKLSSSFNATKP
ncbi:MAG: protoglobin domain-containing protein [Gammaproteobacteria bacterium]|nr:protoglobin domain-containing protein [Gammaproteobacteria bacterium]